MYYKNAGIILVFLLINCTFKINNIPPAQPLIAVLEYRTNAELGEGALWNYKTQELYWIDIEKKLLCLYNPVNKKNRYIKMPSRIGTVVPVNSQFVLTALEDGIYITNLQLGTSELYLDMKDELKDKRLNDGKCDPFGRFWVGSMHLNQEKGEAQLFSINQNGHLDIKIDSVTISNGIAWSEDKSTMYYIDTPSAEIKSYDYDKTTGQISNRKIVIRISESLGFSDGMTIDSEGMLWVGMWNGNAVLRIDPSRGEVIQTIEVPALNVTSCAFGGDSLDELYITTARLGMTEDELQKFPLSGSIFKVKPGVKGLECSFCNTHLQ